VQNGFAQFEFQAGKVELGSVLDETVIAARFIAQTGDELGQVSLALKELVSAPLKKTAQASVRVSD